MLSWCVRLQCSVCVIVFVCLFVSLMWYFVGCEIVCFVCVIVFVCLCVCFFDVVYTLLVVSYSVRFVCVIIYSSAPCKVPGHCGHSVCLQSLGPHTSNSRYSHLPPTPYLLPQDLQGIEETRGSG